ncbi:hypothetical protein [Spiroplasma ixodetis]|uniref:hypothetical protein n=1 Tax=Spiroplasma ixodetis TaxID=2141 RepID=UPI002576877A|nr:hypothetical protein [Spiroplasma ixodetis]
MKYLINSADFTKFDYKFNKFVEKYKNDKNINKVNIYFINIFIIVNLENFVLFLKIKILVKK